MCVRKAITTVILIVCAAAPLLSEQVLIGGEAGWNRIYRMETRIVDEGGISSLQLADNEYRPEADTEMLLQFNRGVFDAGGHYSVKKNIGVQISKMTAKKGLGAAVFTGNGTFLELIPDETAAFAAGSSRLNDFTIEFWLNPARLSEGESILHWSGATEITGETMRQELRCGISGRSLTWEFTNFFLPADMSPTNFVLKSSRSLIPNRWHHHLLRFDSSTGLLEYRIDGIPEDITYTNSSGEEEGEIYRPYIGSAKTTFFLIGRGFTGYLDELRISDSLKEPALNKYSLKSGIVLSGIMDLEYCDSRFTGISAESRTAGETEIYYFYRISNDYFAPDADYPLWNQITSGEMLPPDTLGKYLQVMAELFPDGTGLATPSLYGITVNYDKNLPPMPPAYISGRAGDGKATISWQPVNDADLAGYKIYYGDKPGYYFGTDAVEGKSPVDAGNTLSFQVDGLKNGKLYYFAVTSYDNAEHPHESTFSREISIRPSAVIKED